MRNVDMPYLSFSPHEIVEGMIQSLQEKYVFPDKAQEIASVLRHHLASGTYANQADGTRLAETITEHMRAVSHDKHLRLFYRPEGALAEADEDDFYTPEAIERIRERGIQQNYGLKKIEILDGNIGYFEFHEFMHPHFAGECIQAVMTFLARTRALIIDLRRNGGGESMMVQFFASYFFDALRSEQTQLNGLYDRRKDLLHQYWVLPYVPGPRYLDKPVYLLTSQRTFSGAEEFAYDLQQLKRALVIGEVTGGGAHAGYRYPITAYFEAFIPNTRAINPISGTNWEGVGVQPDIPVAQEEALEVAYRRALIDVG